MQMTAGTEVDHCYLGHLRRCPIMQSARVVPPVSVLTPSLSELSALEDIGPLSAIV